MGQYQRGRLRRRRSRCSDRHSAATWLRSLNGRDVITSFELGAESKCSVTDVRAFDADEDAGAVVDVEDVRALVVVL